MESKSRRSSLSSQLSIEQISKIEFKRVWQATEYSFQRPFIESCKFTNDNTGLYFAGSDGVLRHFDLVKEITIEYPICNGIIWAIDCSLDGEMICTCDAQRQVAVWDTKSMKCLATHHQHKDTVWRVNFTKNCNYVASCSSDLRIILWDFKNDASKLLTGHTKTIEDISFSRNGELLASSSQDRSIMLWKDMNHLPDMKCCAVLKGHENRVTCCVFASHRDDVIASASADCTVIIWDTVKQHQLLRIKGHFNVIWSCGFLRINCDTFVVSCSSDHSVRLDLFVCLFVCLLYLIFSSLRLKYSRKARAPSQ